MLCSHPSRRLLRKLLKMRLPARQADRLGRQVSAGVAPQIVAHEALDVGEIDRADDDLGGVPAAETRVAASLILRSYSVVARLLMPPRMPAHNILIAPAARSMAISRTPAAAVANGTLDGSVMSI